MWIYYTEKEVEGMTLSELILRYRAKHGISQQEMADKLGVTRQTVATAENGERVSAVTETKIRMLIEED